MSRLQNYGQLLRFHHWIKNIFLFTPLFFAGEFFETEKLYHVGAGFLCFSVIASAFYILNDLCDREFDRIHPEKKRKPIASGKVGQEEALFWICFLTGLGLVGAFWLSAEFGWILLGYGVLSGAYSLKLKQTPIVDIVLIATGFVLRIFAGGVLAGVYVSNWLVIMIFLLAVFLALSKRRDDLLLLQDSGRLMRQAIDGYNFHFIQESMGVMASVLIVCYIMYVTSAEVTEKFNTKNVYLTAFFVILGILRYLQVTLVEEESGSPTKVLLRDRFIQAAILLWIASFIFILYL